MSLPRKLCSALNFPNEISNSPIAEVEVRNEARKRKFKYFRKQFRSSANYLSCWEVARSKVEGEQSSRPEWKGKTKQAINSPSIQMWNEILHQATFYSQTFSSASSFFYDNNKTVKSFFFKAEWRDGASSRFESRKRLLWIACSETDCFVELGVNAPSRVAWLTLSSVDSQKYFSHRKVFNNSNFDGFLQSPCFFLKLSFSLEALIFH